MGAIQTRGPSVCGCSARLGVTEVWWDCTSSLGRASKTMGRVLVQPLAYLKALAREQHFGRAAQACHISQATLSAAVRKLEDELGATLILRDSRFQGLTQEGVRAVEWAHHILGDFDAMRDEVAASATPAIRGCGSEPSRRRPASSSRSPAALRSLGPHSMPSSVRRRPQRSSARCWSPISTSA